MARDIALTHLAGQAGKQGAEIALVIRAEARQNGVTAPRKVIVGIRIKAAQSQGTAVGSIKRLSFSGLAFIASFDDKPLRFKAPVDAQGNRNSDWAAFLRLSQWPRIIEAALILCEFAFLKEFADAGLRLVPIRQRDLDNNVLIDILSEEVGVFE